MTATNKEKNQRSIQRNLQKLIIVSEKETTDETERLNVTKQFYKTFFKKQPVKSETEIDEFLATLNFQNFRRAHKFL